MKLEPKPGFDWSRLRWDAATAPQRDDCSYCGAAIGEGCVPLRMWDTAGNAIVFCDACMSTWWGFSRPVQ